MQEQWQESNHEYQEDTVDATLDPIEDGLKIVTSRLVGYELALRVVLANCQFLVERSEEDHCQKSLSDEIISPHLTSLTRDNKHLDRQNDQDVVDLETRVTIVECQESVDGKLRAQIIVLATENLFAHTVP